MESMHYLMKSVAGVPLRRPAWFFDVQEQGEGLTDVGTHLVDLVPWMLCPDQALDYRKDIRVLTAQRWPTTLTRADFQRVTGEPDFPPSLALCVKGDRLDYYCNTLVCYTVRGIHTRLNILWDYEGDDGSGDTHLSVFRGTRSHVEVRQGKEQNYRPELYVAPNNAHDLQGVREALRRKVAALQSRYPGIAVLEEGPKLRVAIPDQYRVGHEAHFAAVTRQFLRYFHDRSALPSWERPNMLAKYYVTTKGVELSQQATA
jgi:hypothetical protein